MKWYTHAAIGANAVWLTVLFGEPTQTAILYTAVGAFAALLPDIDAGWTGSRGAKIHYIAGGLFGIFKGLFRHRGFFHSFLSIVLLFCALIPLAWMIDPLFPLIFTAGYASHLFIDAWNGGMQWFYPLRKDLTFVPKFFRFRVGSAGDDLFFLLGVWGLILFVFMHWSTFASANLYLMR